MRRRAVVLPLLLTTAAAAADAISYLGLGKVFPANMTGNTVLLGIGIATGDWSHTARSGVALAGFVVGAALAGARPHPRRHWLRGPAPDSAAELALLTAALVWWLVGGPPRLALIALLSVSMGLQSAAVSRLELGVTATYITGTWTAVSGWVARLVTGQRPDKHAEHGLQAAVVVWYFAIALLAAYVFHEWKSWALLIPVVALAVAVLTATRHRLPS